MANIGLKYMICAPLTETTNTSTYNAGQIIARAIKADLSIELAEANLSADDRVVESVKEFKGGKITLNCDDLSYETRALLLGHTIEDIMDGTTKIGQKLVAKADDDGAYVGVGFYATALRDGKRKYRAFWCKKVKFGTPSESLETRGDSLNFQTPTLEGNMMADIYGIWKEEGLFNDEMEAVGWLNKQTNIVEE